MLARHAGISRLLLGRTDRERERSSREILLSDDQVAGDDGATGGVCDPTEGTVGLQDGMDGPAARPGEFVYRPGRGRNGWLALVRLCVQHPLGHGRVL